MTETPEPEGDLPPGLRFLRILVTILTATMIAGVVTIVILIVIRVPARAPALPDEISLPDDVTAQSVTFGTGWYGVVTDDGRFLLFNKDGKLRQDVTLDLPKAN